jgi:hypothetical protein
METVSSMLDFEGCPSKAVRVARGGGRGAPPQFSVVLAQVSRLLANSVDSALVLNGGRSIRVEGNGPRRGELIVESVASVTALQ